MGESLERRRDRKMVCCNESQGRNVNRSGRDQCQRERAGQMPRLLSRAQIHRFVCVRVMDFFSFPFITRLHSLWGHNLRSSTSSSAYPVCNEIFMFSSSSNYITIILQPQLQIKSFEFRVNGKKIAVTIFLREKNFFKHFLAWEKAGEGESHFFLAIFVSRKKVALAVDKFDGRSD